MRYLTGVLPAAKRKNRWTTTVFTDEDGFLKIGRGVVDTVEGYVYYMEPDFGLGPPRLASNTVTFGELVITVFDMSSNPTETTRYFPCSSIHARWMFSSISMVVCPSDTDQLQTVSSTEGLAAGHIITFTSLPGTNSNGSDRGKKI